MVESLGGDAASHGSVWLEGDGPLILHAYEEIATVRTAVQSAYYPNVTVTQRIANGDASLQQRLEKHASDCISPGLLYFLTKFGDDHSLPVYSCLQSC